MNNQETGRFIRQLRMSKNMTQKELAEKLFITDKAISKWERGLGCPDISLLPLLADSLGVQIEDILNGGKVSLSNLKEFESDVSLKETKNIKNFLKKRYVKVIMLISLVISCLFSIITIISVVAIIPQSLTDAIYVFFSLLITWFTIVGVFCFIPVVSSYTWYRLST